MSDPLVEDKETRPPPRYNEGTLIDAMQNAWRFVEDEALRERLKEAKNTGTPATRAEIIRGLKAQEFLMIRGRNTVSTERGLACSTCCRERIWRWWIPGSQRSSSGCWTRCWSGRR